MFEKLMLLAAIAAACLCAEIPASHAPAPVYRREAEHPQADSPVYKPEVDSHHAAERPQVDYKPEVGKRQADVASYKPEVERAQESVYKPEVQGPQRREPFSVDLMAEQGGYVQERNRHAVQGAPQEGPTGPLGYAAGAVAQAQPPQEVTYPDVAYAPGYGYEPMYGSQQAFDRYGNAVGFYEQEPEPYSPPTALSLLWSALPDARGVAGAVGRTLSFALSSAFVVALGAALTVAVCAFTGLCAVSFRGLAVTEEMRSLVTDQRLQQIATAAGFVQRALSKYRALQRGAPEGRR